MKPTYDNVFVTEVAKETTTAGGIILTGDVDKSIKPAKILAIGPDVHDVRVGDKVYLKWGEGLPVTHEGTKGVIIPQKHIVAVL